MSESHAKLSSIVEQIGRVGQRYEGFQAGGGGIVAEQEVILKNASCKLAGESLEITFSASGGSVEGTCEAMGLPKSWEQFGRLQMTASTGDKPAHVELVIVGARCRIIDERDLAANQTAEFDIDLIDLPLAAGIRPLYEPTGVRVVASWDGGATRTITVGDIRLTGDNPARPCVDQFGQRVNGDWPTKLHSQEEFDAFVHEEAEQLAAMSPPQQRDEFGGWTGGPKFDASGFFNVHKDDAGRWWLVDPLGNPYWSIGTTGIRTTDVTPVQGREFLYGKLPPRHGEFADCYQEKGFGFYRWNVLRKYGSKDAWKQRVLERFRKWGFNTIANWSEELMLEQQLVPHTRSFRSREDQTPVAGKSFPDVFDPSWEKLLDRLCKEHVAPNRDNKWLIGYFVDNEAPWKNMRLLSCGDIKLRDAWLNFVRGRLDSPAKASVVFGRTLGDWKDVRNLQDTDIADEGPARELMRQFEVQYAELYFGTIRRMLKKHDPNHLYLGCRFTRQPAHESIIAVAGKHVDVMSVNCYSLIPMREDFDVWYNAGGRPILIGEHHLPLKSNRQLQPLYQAFTTQERRQYVAQFEREWAHRKYSVGSHWFQHADQPLTGRWQDGEDQTVGFVDITDRPHPELVEALREVAASLYEWHAKSE